MAVVTLFCGCGRFRIVKANSRLLYGEFWARRLSAAAGHFGLFSGRFGAVTK